jgi:glucose/arabinose dehydrogenase
MGGAVAKIVGFRLVLAVCALAAPFAALARPEAEPGYTVDTIADGFKHPWSLAFLPDGGMLVTERPGRISVIRAPAAGSPASRTPVSGVPPVYENNQAGLFEVVLHPRFADNRLVYLSYVQGHGLSNTLRVARARLDGFALRDLAVIYEVAPKRMARTQYGGRMLFLPDGTLLITLGDAFDSREAAQRLDNPLGKIIRLRDDGSVPPDNPFAGVRGARPEIWSYGHRHPQGICRDPETGRVYSTENGAAGGDELNLINKGVNYGWPLATFGRDYSGGRISPFSHYPGTVDAIAVWTPSIAPSGVTVYRGAAFPDWNGDIFVAALKGRQIRRVDMEGGRIMGQQAMLGDLDARMRDVRTGPDGLLYVLDDSNGRILRIRPARGWTGG